MHAGQDHCWERARYQRGISSKCVARQSRALAMQWHEALSQKHNEEIDPSWVLKPHMDTPTPIARDSYCQGLLKQCNSLLLLQSLETQQDTHLHSPPKFRPFSLPTLSLQRRWAGQVVLISYCPEQQSISSSKDQEDPWSLLVGRAQKAGNIPTWQSEEQGMTILWLYAATWQGDKLLSNSHGCVVIAGESQTCFTTHSSD